LATSQYGRKYGRGTWALRAEFHGTLPQNWPCHEIPRNRLNNLGHPEPGLEIPECLVGPCLHPYSLAALGYWAGNRRRRPEM